MSAGVAWADQGAVGAYLVATPVPPLLDAPPSPVDDEGITPLWTAAYGGFAEIVRALLEAGADPDTFESRWKMSSLSMAVQNGHIEIVEMLLAAGAAVEGYRPDGNTPLIVAGHRGRTEIARILLDAGADINARSRRGMTPLSAAVESGQLITAKFLAENGGKD